jgi:mannose-6-phosphate isomerase-like protein (cupin superfamily)
MGDEVRDIVEGEGYAAGHLDVMGDQYGFRKVRRALNVQAFGINAIVTPAGFGGPMHWHDEQEETYFVHQGRLEFEFGDGRKLVLGPGGAVRVDAQTHRKFKNVGDEDAVVVIAGGKDGYVGRDGNVREGEERIQGPAEAAGSG